MNIYIQELKMSVKSTIYWTAGMLITLIFFMMMFPVISKDAAIMQQILEKFPPEFTKALGMTSLDLSVVTGFYGFLFIYILLIGSIFAMRSGLSSLSEEIRVKTVDFLVAKPVSRTVIVSAKLAGVLTCLLFQNIVYITAATTVLLSTFILSVAIDLYDKIDFLKYFTPFKYFNTVRVMREREFDPVFLLLSAAIVIGSTSLTYILYKKRDIKA